MKDLKEIKPGVGLGELKFGMYRVQVKNILGDPSEVEAYSNSSFREEPAEAWHYDDWGLSMSFDAEEDWRLVILSVSSNEFELAGKNLVGLNRLEFISILKELGMTKLEFEEEVIYSKELGLSFWIEDETVSEIQWSPMLLDEYTIDWPEY